MSALGVPGVTTCANAKAGAALVAETFPKRSRPMALGFLQALSTVGNIMAAVITLIIGDLEVGRWNLFAAADQGNWAVWGTSATNVYAANWTGVVHYDGVEWVAGDTMPVAWLGGVWGSGPNDVFAVGDDGGIFHYDGISWTPMTSGLEGSGEYLNTVWGLSSTDVYAAASNGVLHWDGVSWSPLPGVQECEHYSVWGTSPSNLFVANICGISGTWITVGLAPSSSARRAVSGL